MPSSLSGSLLIFSFDRLTPSEKNAFLAILNDRGYLHAFKEQAVINARLGGENAIEKIHFLKGRVRQLESENSALKRDAKIRLTPEERKSRIAELKEEGWNATDIAKRMTTDGERITPGAVRVSLWRMKKSQSG